MQAVLFGREWDIRSSEDYCHAMSTLDDNEFCAEFSGITAIMENEKHEIDRQRAQVIMQARSLNLI